MIARDTAGADTENLWELSPTDMSNADGAMLRNAGYYTALRVGEGTASRNVEATNHGNDLSRSAVALAVSTTLCNAVVIGPGVDRSLLFIDAFVRAHNHALTHARSYDIDALITGYLYGAGRDLPPLVQGTAGLYETVGVPVPALIDNALIQAEKARDAYGTVTGPGGVPLPKPLV